MMAENPGVQFYNDERGYVRCTITPKTWRSEFRTVAEVDEAGCAGGYAGVVRCRSRQAVRSELDGTGSHH